jgi:hypothetical protein
MLEKLKSLLAEDALYISFLIIFVATASFGLGRVSVTSGVDQMASPSGVTIIQPQTKKNNPETPQKGSEVQLVASKSGTRYHLLTCPGASQIKEANKLFFSSVNDAEAAGYTPAANCQFE